MSWRKIESPAQQMPSARSRARRNRVQAQGPKACSRSTQSGSLSIWRRATQSRGLQHARRPMPGPEDGATGSEACSRSGGLCQVQRMARPIQRPAAGMEACARSRGWRDRFRGLQQVWRPVPGPEDGATDSEACSRSRGPCQVQRMAQPIQRPAHWFTLTAISWALFLPVVHAGQTSGSLFLSMVHAAQTFGLHAGHWCMQPRRLTYMQGTVPPRQCGLQPGWP